MNEGRRLMLRFLGLVVLIGTTFVLGYYIGQRPISELRKTVRDLSRDVLDTTLGIERNLRQRHGLVDAKSRLIQAKSELLDRNFGNAAKELAEAVDHLEKASSVERDSGRTSSIKPLVARIRETQLELAVGKAVPRTRLDEIQKELDRFVARQ